jgi:hypothetical protein
MRMTDIYGIRTEFANGVCKLSRNQQREWMPKYHARVHNDLVFIPRTSCLKPQMLHVIPAAGESGHLRTIHSVVYWLRKTGIYKCNILDV